MAAIRKPPALTGYLLYMMLGDPDLDEHFAIGPHLQACYVPCAPSPMLSSSSPFPGDYPSCPPSQSGRLCSLCHLADPSSFTHSDRSNFCAIRSSVTF